MNGVLCVMTPGEMLMLLWCVDSWDIPLKVNTKINFNMPCYKKFFCLCSDFQFDLHHST